jgi:hypothetical protein
MVVFSYHAANVPILEYLKRTHGRNPTSKR